MSASSSDKEKNAIEKIIGESPYIKELKEEIKRLAKREMTFLILGDTGTGKELVANAIHQESNRRKGPFVAVDCGAIPHELLESELFGHEKGAFTGADRSKKGRVEEAEGGILFLDEIGNMREDHQAKLLRFLQVRKYRLVGGTEEKEADIRVIAATNDPKALRSDFLARLSQRVIRLKPLSDRPVDRIVLINHFLHKYKIRADPKALFLMYSADFINDVRSIESLAMNMDDFIYIQRELLTLYANRQDIECMFKDYDSLMKELLLWSALVFEKGIQRESEYIIPWSTFIKMGLAVIMLNESSGSLSSGLWKQILDPEDRGATATIPDFLDAFVLINNLLNWPEKVDWEKIRQIFPVRLQPPPSKPEEIDWNKIVRAYEYATLSLLGKIPTVKICQEILHCRKESFKVQFGFTPKITLSESGPIEFYNLLLPGWSVSGKFFPDWITEYFEGVQQPERLIEFRNYLTIQKYKNKKED